MLTKITEIKLVTLIVILLAFAMMISSMISANIVVHAQRELPNIMIPPKKSPVKTTISPSPPSSSILPPKIHSVKITSPTTGQRVPIGKDLAISGTSIDDANSNNCQVSIIVNSIKPYQPTRAAGPGGANDYSKWNFVLSPSKYTTVKLGPNNKITSKYTCIDNPTVTSYNSVNVTGTPIAIGAAPTSTTAADITPTSITKKPISVSNNATNAAYTSKSSKINNLGSHVASITPPSLTALAPNQIKPVFNSNIMPNLNSSDLHIKITSPIDGQGISVGKNFTMTGTSSDNTATDCKVYAGLNRLKPYPPAIATGPGGTTDYSKWYFDYSPAYQTAIDGNNKLTAKLSCNNNPSLVKYDTMNITGITAARTTGLPISSANTPDTTAKVNQLHSASDNTRTTSNHELDKIGGGSSSTTSNTDLNTNDNTDKSVQTSDNTRTTSNHELDKTGGGSSSTTSNTDLNTNDNTDKSVQSHTKIKIRHDIPIKNNKKSNELADNIVKDVKRHLKKGTALANSEGAAASAGTASAYAGADGISVSAGGITLNLP
jgi:hypothetical protein